MDIIKLALASAVMIANKAIGLYKIEIPLEQLQSTLEARFPISKKKYLLALTLSDPLVKLEENANRIDIELTVCLAMPGNLNTQRRGLVYGSLDYNRSQGEFYLLNPTLHEFNGNGGLNSQQALVYAILEALLDKLFATMPIYRLQEENIQHLLTKLLLKSVFIRKDKIIMELGLY